MTSKEKRPSLISYEKYDDGHHRLHVGDIFSLPQALRDDWMVTRQEFMDNMGWHYEGDDTDDYDTHRDTKQLIMLDQEGRIVTGMRLTRLDSAADAISLGMLELPGDTVSDKPGPVYDLTRLVPGEGLKGKGALESLMAFAKLFGAGLEHADRHDGVYSPELIFAVERSFFEAFERFGIPFTAIEEVARYELTGPQKQSVSAGRGDIAPGELPKEEILRKYILASANPRERTEFLESKVKEQGETSRYAPAYTAVTQGIKLVRDKGL